MNFDLASLQDKAYWEERDTVLPQFDVEAMREASYEDPRWIHYGPGNIFKAYICALQQDLLDRGIDDRGIVAVESFSAASVDQVLLPYDLLTLQVVMKADGGLDKRVIASISEAIFSGAEAGWNRLKTIAENPKLAMISFTITEKGYNLTAPSGEYSPAVLSDMAMDPGKDLPKGTMSQVAALLYHRYMHGAHPITLVSFDNFSHNGEKLHDSVLTIAKAWEEKGVVDADFIAYVEDQTKVSTPLTVIDRITPRPSEDVADILTEQGLDAFKMTETEAGGFFAPFVNVEEAQYLVIEDRFANGRPKLEEAGVYFTDAETADKFERMKVTTCLNPLHTAMSPFGVLLGHPTIAASMQDPAIVALIHRIGYTEGLPVVTDPGIISPKDFIDEVVEHRFTNPFLPDTPERIMTDTSQKVGIRFGETIKSYLTSDELKVEDLRGLPLGIAGWIRYLMGIDDQGNRYEISPDPLGDSLKETVKTLEFDNPDSLKDQLREILGNVSLFRVDLYEAGLGEQIEGYVRRMLEGPGSVRRLIDEETATY